MVFRSCVLPSRQVAFNNLSEQLGVLYHVASSEVLKLIRLGNTDVFSGYSNVFCYPSLAGSPTALRLWKSTTPSYTATTSFETGFAHTC